MLVLLQMNMCLLYNMESGGGDMRAFNKNIHKKEKRDKNPSLQIMEVAWFRERQVNYSDYN